MKDNKKVIVPIIIGIALLIAIVVGITYAYFQATNNASGTTNLDATTEAIGNVVVTNPTEELYLKLSAYEMHEDQKNNSYYATSTNGDGVVYASERENNVFANYSIEGGTDNTTYNCTFKLNITKPQDIRAGDMNLEISLLNGAKINGGSTLTTDLYNAASSYNVEFSAKGNGNGNLITGDIKLNNTTSVQDHLIGKILSTTIRVSDLSCEVAEPEEELAAGLYKTDGTFVSWEQLTDTNYKSYDIEVGEDDEGNYIYEKRPILYVKNGALRSAIQNTDKGYAPDELVGKLVIDDSVKAIDNYAFYNCTGLTEVIIPDSVTTIGTSAFAYATNLSNVVMSNNITRIGTQAFFECTNLTSLYLPESLNIIINEAFLYSGIEELIIPEGIEEIQLYDMPNLETITLPSTIIQIASMFPRCENLSVINYNGTMEQWNKLFKEDDWNEDCPQITVHCIDGDIIVPAYSA